MTRRPRSELLTRDNGFQRGIKNNFVLFLLGTGWGHSVVLKALGGGSDILQHIANS